MHRRRQDSLAISGSIFVLYKTCRILNVQLSHFTDEIREAQDLPKSYSYLAAVLGIQFRSFEDWPLPAAKLQLIITFCFSAHPSFGGFEAPGNHNKNHVIVSLSLSPCPFSCPSPSLSFCGPVLVANLVLWLLFG